MERWGVRAVREIVSPAFQREHQSETFHGRDVFSPAGAHLAVGSPPFAQRGRLSLALNMGDAAKTYLAKRGDALTVSIER